MLRVGLTGSIGVGKTFVTSVLAELGCHVIDADAIAREVVLPGSKGLSRLVEAFGEAILHPDGTLDRGRLAALVFGNKKKLKLLNSLLHPYIIASQDQKVQELEIRDPQGIVIVDAALMIESGGYKRFDKLIVVHCSPEVQVKRVMARNGLSIEEAEKRIRAQMSQEEKMVFADYLIDTSQGFEATREQTKIVFQELQTVAKTMRS